MYFAQESNTVSIPIYYSLHGDHVCQCEKQHLCSKRRVSKHDVISGREALGGCWVAVWVCVYAALFLWREKALTSSECLI